MEAGSITGRWLDRLSALLFFAMMTFGFAFFCIYMPFSAPSSVQHNLLYLAASCSLGLIPLVFALYCLYAFVNMFTVYVFDGDGITARGLRHNETMQWSEVVNLRTTGGTSSDMVLTDIAGRALRVRTSLVHDPKHILKQAIETYLADVRERQIRENGLQDFTHYGLRWAGWFLLPFTLMFAGATLYLPFTLTPAERFGFEFWFCLIAGAALSLLMAWANLLAFTKSISFRHGELIDKSIFGERHILVSQIAAVMSRDIQTKNGTSNWTTVQGTNGQQIKLSSHLPDYELVREYLRRQAGSAAQAQGETLRKVVERKEARQGLVILPVCLLLLGILIGGVCVMSARTLWQEHLLDQRGIVVTGRVTDKTTASGYIRYVFTRDGSDFRSKDKVRFADYEAARIGQSIAVRILPDNPAVSELTISTAGSGAWFLLIMNVVCFGLLLFLTVPSYAKLKQKAQQPITETAA